jgi:hypothetical protein
VIAARESISAPEGHGDQVRGAATLITGRVIERSGRPLASASCELRPSVPSGGFIAPGTDELPVQTTTTSGEDGTFRLEAGAGFWLVTVQSPGFARCERDHLRAGDEVLVRLDPEMLFLVSVVGPAGEPVDGAELIVRTAGETTPEAMRCRMKTDPEGRASTRDLTPGAWTLVVRHPAHAVVGVPLEIPVGLHKFEKEVRLERGTRLAGTVRTEDGAPIPGARIHIESPYRDTLLSDETTCDLEGRYETRSIFSLQETLEVLASAPGYAESSTWLGIQPHQAGAGEAILDFALPRAGRTVRGRAVAGPDHGVPEASVRIAAVDPVGIGQEDTLAALQMAPHAPWLWQEVVRTDGTGSFELSNLSAIPQYVLMIVHDSSAPRIVWVPPAEGGSVTELGDLELPACGSLFGRATYADGSPAEGATLFLYEVNQVMVADERELGIWRPDSWFHPLETRVGAEGGFRFDQLTPGIYQFLSVVSESKQVEPRIATGPVDLVIPVKPRPKSEVAGFVRNSAGESIPMVFVRAFAREEANERLVSTVLVDGHGAFSVRVPADSSSRLVFTDLRGAHEERSVLLDPASHATPLEVVLDARAYRLPPLDGIVFGPRGDAVESCAVTLHPPEDSLCACIAFHARTDPAGTFRFDVFEGPHRLVASDPRFATGTYAPAWPGDHVVIDLKER